MTGGKKLITLGGLDEAASPSGMYRKFVEHLANSLRLDKKSIRIVSSPIYAQDFTCKHTTYCVTWERVPVYEPYQVEPAGELESLRAQIENLDAVVTTLVRRMDELHDISADHRDAFARCGRRLDTLEKEVEAWQ